MSYGPAITLETAKKAAAAAMAEVRRNNWTMAVDPRQNWIEAQVLV